MGGSFFWPCMPAIGKMGKVAIAYAQNLGAPFFVFERIPAEISFDWIFFPPFLIAVVLGCLCAFATTRLLNTTGLGRYFWHPGLTFLAFWVMLTSLIGLTFLPP